MASRTVDGPDHDWLDMQDLVRLLRVSESTIKRWIARGDFPRPVEVSPGVRMWYWEDVYHYRYRLLNRARFARPEESGPPAPPDDA